VRPPVSEESRSARVTPAGAEPDDRGRAVKASPIAWASASVVGTDFWNLVSRGRDTHRELSERRDLGTGRHARHESVGQRDEKQAVLSRARLAPSSRPDGDRTRGGVVDRIGKEKNLHPQILSIMSSIRYAVMANRTVVTRPTTMMTIRTTLGERRRSAWPSHRPQRANEEHVDGVDDQVPRTTNISAAIMLMINESTLRNPWSS